MHILLLLIALLLGSLLLVHWANRREQSQREARLRLRRLRWRIDTLEEVLVGLEEILSNRGVARCVNQEILHLLKNSRELETGDVASLDTRIAQVEERDEQLGREPTQTDISRLCESDAQIARRKDCLERAARVMRRQHGQNRLDSDALQRHLADVSWARLMIEVVTNVAEGHKALKRGDITSSQAHYKKAQGLLISSDHPSPQRMEMIRELGEVIQGKRKALSPELMPEDGYNP